MPKLRTEKEIEHLVELACAYCSVRSEYRIAKAEGRLTADEDREIQLTLDRMDERLELLKSNNELDRRRARKQSNILTMVPFKQRSAR